MYVCVCVCAYQKEVLKMTVPKVSTLVFGFNVAKELHVNDCKEHQEEPRQHNNHQQFGAVPDNLEEEPLDGSVRPQ